MSEDKSVKRNLDWRRVTLLVVLIVLVLLFIIFVFNECNNNSVIFCGEEYELIRFLGWSWSFLLASWGIWVAHQRAVALNKTAEAQANAVTATETGNRQERFRDAVAHLGHEQPSVQMGGVHALFQMALENAKDMALRASIADILCSHIRATTGKKKYQEEYKDKASTEVQSIMELLFTTTQTRTEKKLDEFWQDLTPDLSEAWLCGLIFTGGRLRGAKLRGTQFQRARLWGAQFQRAELWKAQFQGAELWRAQFQGAKLGQAQFQEAKLGQAQFQEAYLGGAQFQGANLDQAQFQGADLWRAQFQGAKLGQAQFQEANLMEAQLQGAELWKAEFQGANLYQAQFQGAKLGQAQFQEANLTEAQLQGAELWKAEFQGANLWKAEFQGANLYQAQFQGANLGQAQFQGAKLGQAQFQGANLGQAQLQGAELGQAQFQGANLYQAQLQGANLWKAQLQGVKLGETQFQGAYLGEAQLQGVRLWDTKFQGVQSKSNDEISRWWGLDVAFAERIREFIDKPGDLGEVVLCGGLSDADVENIMNSIDAYVLADEKKKIEDRLKTHVGERRPDKERAMIQDMEQEGALGQYGKDEAEAWIKEYYKALTAN